MTLDTNTVLDAGLQLLRYKVDQLMVKKLKLFCSAYGIEAATACDVLSAVLTDVVGAAKIEKLDIHKFCLTLYWMRKYDIEKDIMRHSAINATDTLRKYLKMYLKALQALAKEKENFVQEELYLVKMMLLDFPDFFFFFYRKITWDVSNQILFGSIDGTHCPIQEPRRAPSSIWYSHKFNGPGLTYQIVLSTCEDKVLSAVGPFPAGESDL
jgi:hypothetical protein